LIGHSSLVLGLALGPKGLDISGTTIVMIAM